MDASRDKVEWRMPKVGQEIARQSVRAGGVPRPAWVEVDLSQLRANLRVIGAALPHGVRWLAVVKANAYGHGMETVAREAVGAGASLVGVATLGEGVALREAGLEAPVLLLGERHPDELPYCLQYQLRVSVGDLNTAGLLNQLAERARVVVPVHVKVNTGMNRFGFDCAEAAEAARRIRGMPGLLLEGVMSHFSMSDEADKTFAVEQLRRFNEVMAEMQRLGVGPGLRHLCNSGGFLDLPAARLDMVRLGILPCGVYPSAVCQRIEGIRPVLSVKAKIVVVRELKPGEIYGYGLKYRATERRRIGVLPLGYGDGYPRLRNQGEVLVAGRRVPVIGGVAMDAIGVDLTEVPEAGLWDEAVLLGRQGSGEISARELAGWGGTVCYDLLAGWGSRLPRWECAPG